MDLVGTALGYLISVVQVAEDLNHVIGSPAGLDVNPFRMILPIVPGLPDIFVLGPTSPVKALTRSSRIEGSSYACEVLQVDSQNAV